jgi:hypothetical protein
MAHRFVIDLLKEKRNEIEKRLRYQIIEDVIKKLRAQVVEINRAIFVLLRDARK